MPNPFDKGATATATAEAPAAAPVAAPAKKAAAKAPAAKAKPAASDGFDAVDDKGQHTPGKSGDPFSAPPGMSEYKITDLVGSLMLVKPTEVIEEMDTEVGHAENVIRADVVVLEETTIAEDGTVLPPGYEIQDVLVFNMALKRALLRVLEGPNPYLLGRLGMGTAKKGKNAPYIFERPDEDDANLARQWLAVNPV